MEILFVFILLYAGKHAWDQAWDAWSKSRSAYLDRADKRHPDMPKSRRTGHALRHDLGYGLSQAWHGFPQARHGFASGWHQGRQAHAQAQAERERVKAEHLETRARLIPDLIAYRKRQKEALERIRRGAGPEVKQAQCTHAPAPCVTPGNCPCDCPDCREAKGDPGRRYVPGHEPDPQGRVRRPVASALMATGAWGLLPGRAQGALCGCAICRGEESAEEGSEGRRGDFEPVLLTARSKSGRVLNPIVGGPVASAAVWNQEDLDRRLAAAAADPDIEVETRPLPRPEDYDAAADCDLCGRPLPPGYTGIAHAACLEVYERDNAKWEVRDNRALEDVERDLRRRERCPWQIKPGGHDGGAIYCGQPIEDSGADEPDEFCPQHQREADSDDEGAAEELNEHVRNLLQEAGNPTTEGSVMPTGAPSGDTTYTQQMNELTAIRQDAEEEVNSVRRKRMLNRLDILTGLGLDSKSLSEAAAIDDALRDQQKAAQQTLDAADTAIGGLKQRHGGIKEAVDSAPVDKPAQPEFYQD